MKQVLQRRSGLVIVREVPQPPCPPGSVLVRTAFSAISSGTERARVVESQKSLLARARERPDVARDVMQRARREGVRATRAVVQRKLAEETAVGYSSAGEVVRVGSAVRGLDVGDLVACAGAGHANHAEIVSVPVNLCAKIPSGVPLEAASLTTVAAIALHAIRLADVRIGERVAVVGCGLVGQIACRLLHATGAEVFALDVDAARVDQAVAKGADRGCVIDDQAAERVIALTVGTGMDAVLVTAAAPSNDPLLLAAEIARDRAVVVLVGDVPIELPRRPLYEKELSFRVSRSYGPGRYDADYEERGVDYPIGYVRWTMQRNMECVLDLQARGLLTLEDCIDAVIPVANAPQAYARLLGDPEHRPGGALVLSYTQSDDDSARQHPSPTVEAGRAEPRPSDGPPRIGLVGPGGFATTVLIPALERAGARLEIVGGGSGPSAAAAWRERFARVAEDEEEVVTDPDVDAVVISTRHESHAELAVKALEAGKHVFCEKPIALSEAELAGVLEAAARTDRVLAVGFNRRFAPLLGRLRTFFADADSAFVANYRVSAGSIAPEHWVHDLQQGGGRIIGEICHFVDALSFLAGSSVKSVAAAAAQADHRRPLQTRDNVVVSLTFSNGSVGTVVYASAGSPRVPKERLEVFCGSRTAILDDYRRIELYREEGVEREDGRKPDKGHDAEVAAFLDSIRRGRHPVPLDVVANVSLATFAIVESLATGAAIRLDHGG